MGSKTKFYDVKDTIKASPQTRLFFITGQRGVGKSYSVKKWIINQFLNNNKKFVYVRRWTTEIMNGALWTVFDDVVRDKSINWAKVDKDNKYYEFHILPKASFFYLVGETVDGNLEWLYPIGRFVALSKSETFKGGTYNDYNTIFFDEFISENNGIHNEVELFGKIINTVGRGVNKDLRIFCCGNPDYSIELNPMLQGLHLDYAHLQDNTAYYYDSRDENGKVIANNICFIKLANFKGEYLNNVTAHLFGSAEEMMSTTGEVKKEKFIHFDDISDFRPSFELEIETPIVDNQTYHKRIYVYYGEMWNEAVCVIMKHHKYDVASLYCRYDKTVFKARKTRQTYLINIPLDLVDLRRLMSMVDTNQLFIANDDSDGTLYKQMREKSNIL